MGLTAGHLGKGICPWELQARGGGGKPSGGRLQDDGSATGRQMEGLKRGIPSPRSSLTIWRATHSQGNVLQTAKCARTEEESDPGNPHPGPLFKVRGGSVGASQVS